MYCWVNGKVCGSEGFIYQSMDNTRNSKIESFDGFISELETGNSCIKIRLTPWGYSEEDNPNLWIQADNYEVTQSDGITLRSIKAFEYEISEIERHEKKLIFWIDHYDKPLVIRAEKIKFETEPYTEKEYKGFIKQYSGQINRHQKEVINLRNKLHTFEAFIFQQLKRNQAKFDIYAKGSLGHEILHEQLKLLNKVVNKLKQ